MIVVIRTRLYSSKMGNRGARERREVYIDKRWVMKTIQTEASKEDILALGTRMALKIMENKFHCSSYTNFKELLMIYNEGDCERTVAHVAITCAMAILAKREYHLHPKTLAGIICKELSLPWIVHV